MGPFLQKDLQMALAATGERNFVKLRVAGLNEGISQVAVARPTWEQLRHSRPFSVSLLSDGLRGHCLEAPRARHIILTSHTIV
jgi:hypothetical protein